VNCDAGIADVELARMVSAGASWSSKPNTSRFNSTRSGRFSCTHVAPAMASSICSNMNTRPAARLASSTRPAACCSSRLVRMCWRAMSNCVGALSYSCTRQPARANTIAHARPIRPAPMIAAIRSSMRSHPEDAPA
jgi:hypothetical protein